MKTTVIGIDSGASGGIAWKYPESWSECAAMPKTPSDIVALVRSVCLQARQVGGEPVVFLENLVKHMGPGIPASTMAVYASNWGTIQGVVICMGARLELITPQLWQKTLNLGISGRQKSLVIPGMSAAQVNAEKKRVRLANGQVKRDWKNKLKAEAQRLFPHMSSSVTLSTADAVLLLEYGLRKTAE